MTRSELVEALAAKFPALSAADLATAARVILAAMEEALEESGRIEIRGFGSFSTVVRPPRTGRNPKTGVTVKVPAKRVVHFKPGLDLRERVDRAAQRVRIQLEPARQAFADRAQPKAQDPAASHVRGAASRPETP